MTVAVEPPDVQLATAMITRLCRANRTRIPMFDFCCRMHTLPLTFPFLCRVPLAASDLPCPSGSQTGAAIVETANRPGAYEVHLIGSGNGDGSGVFRRFSAHRYRLGHTDRRITPFGDPFCIKGTNPSREPEQKVANYNQSRYLLARWVTTFNHVNSIVAIAATCWVNRRARLPLSISRIQQLDRGI